MNPNKTMTPKPESQEEFERFLEGGSLTLEGGSLTPTDVTEEVRELISQARADERKQVVGERFIVSENMVMWAFRYALGRRTGAVDSVVRHLKMHWNKLRPFTQSQIKEEITKAVDSDCAGGDCDVESWKEILDQLQPKQ